MNALTFNDVLTELWYFDVSVRDNKLMVKGGDRLNPIVKEAVKLHRDSLIKYYSSSDLMQDLIEKIQKEIDPIQKKFDTMSQMGQVVPEDYQDQLRDLWDRYYKLIELRRENMSHPWAKVEEDHRRCPKCPYLGQKERPDGIMCDRKC